MEANLGEKMNKNRLTIFLSLSLVVFVVLGCGFGGLFGGSDTESTSGDAKKQTEAKPSGDVVKVGIPECDEVATYINDNSEEIEGSIILRGIVYMYKNYILKHIKDGIEKMDDEQKKKFAEICSKTLKDLKKSMKK